jgi:amino acid adenylation domain-containing protein
MKISELENLSGAIAVIGLAGKFPGAADPDVLWANVAAGKDTITHFDRTTVEARDRAAQEFGPDYVPARGVLEDVDMFDSAFFNIAPREADFLDPQHRLFLEACWTALESGGYDPLRYPGLIGLYGGCSLNTYLLANLCADRSIIDEVTANYQVGEFNRIFGNDKDFLTTRVAYKLNLRGPCVTVQSACATSLVAIAQASQSLLNYQCDMALAGGVSATFPQKRGYIYQEGSMGSRDGHCRTFDAEASGTVFGHGVGVVLLKRLEDAIADRDPIRAILRGFAINNDGGAKVGYMAPGVDGQASVIAAAQAMAGVSADEISYIEAHGTATPLGDPIEIAALTQAFRLGTERNSYCAISSTKANIGHLDSAAGVTGVIKTILALQHKQLPPTAHFQKPNPRIDFASTPFYVTSELKEWKSEGPRLAGVSAFGVGGVNAHVVLQEGPEVELSPSLRPAQLLCFSARSEAALDQAINNLKTFHGEHPGANLADVAYTLQTGRHEFDHRAIAVASDLSDFGTVHRSAQRSENSNVVFLFTGQGSQFPGMGRALYETEPIYRQQIDECSELLLAELGIDLRTLLFQNADEALLSETRYAQPALFVTELAMASLWKEWGIVPEAMAGHSLGEFVAAVLAGVMSREDALHLVARRGQLMQQMQPGAMLSVRLGEAELTPLLGDGVSIAGLNSPALSVASGTFEAIEKLEKLLEEKSIGAKRLKTSHAFHSAMMEPMLAAFEEEVRKVKLLPPSTPYVSGVTGTSITSAEATDPQYWARHCRQPVRFADALSTLFTLPNPVLVEVGPGMTLTTLAHQQKTGKEAVILASLPQRSAEIDATGTMLEALGKLWLAGVQPDWNGLYSHERRSRIPLPTYPFERKRHWVEPPAQVQQEMVSQPTKQLSAVNPLMEEPLPMPAYPPTASAVPDRKTRLQGAIATLFEELSGIATGPEAVDAPFVELGFDSLFLTQATQAIQRKFGVKVTFRQMVDQCSTIALLSAFLDSKLPPDALPAEIPAPVALAAAVPQPALPAIPLAGGSAAVEQLLQAQMQMMSQLFSQQLAALQGASHTAPAPIAPAIVAPTPFAAASASQPVAPAVTIDGGKEFKAYGPYKPVQVGTKDGITEKQRQAIDALIARYERKTGKSKQLTQQYRDRMADPRVVAGFRSLWKEMVYPLVTDRSKGSRLWDIDGNEYIDIVNGFGAILLGHAPDFVSAAVHKQIDAGVEIGPQSPLAGEVATLICELTGMERTAFCNTGSEAVMAALRVARTITARDKFVYFSGDYHGMFDEVLVRSTGAKHGSAPIAPGIPLDNTGNVIVLEYGTDASLEYIRQHASEIAAVLVEPIQSRHPHLQPREFLKSLRQITEQAGTALIFDEVVTGFRVALGGAQEYFGIRADMATYGKVLGGGYPIGILSGKREYMDALDGGTWQYGDDSAPEVGVTFFAGTFVRHPLALAAAKAVLHHLKSEGPSLQINLGRRVAETARQIDEIFQQAGLPVHVHAAGTWFYFLMPSDTRFGSLFYYLLREKGIHIQEGFPCFITTAHTDDDLQRIIRAFREAIQEMQAADLLPSDLLPSDLLPYSTTTAAPVAVQALPTPVHQVPLTESQREIWLAANLNNEANCAFNESVTLKLHGSADENNLRRALEQAIDRHDALRSVLDAQHEALRVEPEFHGQIPIMDLSALPAEESASILQDKIVEEGVTPFDLAHGPLVRATIFRTSPEDVSLILTAHHIVMDGWSANQFLEDAGRIYSGLRKNTAPELVPLMPFSSYAIEEQKKAQSGDFAENENYWVKVFAGRAPVLELPTDRPRPAAKSYKGSTLHTALGGDLYIVLKKASAREGCTLYVTLLSAFQMLLHRITHQPEVVVGISAAGQSLMEDVSLVGHCVHFLPMLSDLPDNLTVKEHLAATRTKLLDAYDHQEFTYGTLLRKLRIPRDPSRMPLIEVQFNLERLGAAIEFDGLRTELESNGKQFVNTDLFLNIVETGSDLLIDCDYNTGLIDESTLDRWLRSYTEILNGIIADSSTPVDRVAILDPAERDKVVRVWNQTNADFGPFEAVHRMIERRAAESPDHVAIVCKGQPWSYQQLEDYSNRLARHLRRQGIREGSLVGVCVDRSAEMLGAVLAVLKTGGAYLPLDPSHPSERLELVLQDAGVALLLTQEHLAETLRAEARVICLDGERSLWARESTAPLDGETHPDSLAYVIYTSGSTGKPKGVAIEHGALSNLLLSMQREPGLTANDVLVSVTTLAFDIAALELFLPPMTGSKLVIATREQVIDAYQLRTLLETSGATVLQSTPGAWRMLIEAGWNGQPKLKVLCGGEALPSDLAEALLDRSDEVWNVYGPTETTIWSSATKLKKQAGPVTIGPPIANTQFYILDKHLQPLPVGVSGDLYIGGSGLARGYWHRPELTHEKFVANPFGPGRIYQTGDLGRWLPNGQIELLGRSDFQVKIRGYRIELGEIESVLRQHPAVKEAAVIAVDDSIGHKRLAAYVSTDEAAADLPAKLHSLLASKLPEYMIPAAIVPLEKLPQTPNLKIDRKALQKMELTAPITEVSYTAPETPQQIKLAAIWADVLKLDRVGITDSIFDLGADSLLIFRIAARAGVEGLPINPTQIFQHRTIANLSTALEESNGAETPAVTMAAPIQAVSRERFRRPRA